MENPDLIAAIVSLLVAITGLIKNQSDIRKINVNRNETASARNADSQNLHDDVERLKFHVDANKQNIGLLFTKSDDMANAVSSLTTQVAVMDSKLDQLIESVNDLKKRKNTR